MPKFSQRSLNALANVDPELRRVFMEAIKETPVDFVVTEGLRSDARQKEYFKKGRTTPGPKVTNADGRKNLSNHQDAADGKRDGLGSAVDIYPYVDGALRIHEKYVDEKLKLIAVHVKAVAKCLGVAITWGGDWKNPYDPPHFQLTKK